MGRGCRPGIVLPLDRGGNIITSLGEVADTFSDHCANISRDLHERNKPGRAEVVREKESYHLQTEN